MFKNEITVQSLSASSKSVDFQKNSNIKILENFYDSLKTIKDENKQKIIQKNEVIAQKLKKKYANPKRANLAESKKGR